MSDNIRDQLLGLGFKPAPKPERKPEVRRDGRPQGKPGQGRPQAGNKPAHAGKPAQQGKPSHPGKPGQGRPQQGPRKPRSQEDIDLAKAYAIRAQKEKDERIQAEQAKQEEARLRREARAKLDELIADKGLNDPDADIAVTSRMGARSSVSTSMPNSSRRSTPASSACCSRTAATCW